MVSDEYFYIIVYWKCDLAYEKIKVQNYDPYNWALAMSFKYRLGTV